MGTPVTAYQYRFCPASYLHPEQLPSSWRPVIALLPDWRSSGHINGALLEALALETDYQAPVGLGAIALLAQPALESLLCRLGLVLHAEAIRHCLQAEPLRQLMALLEHDALRQLMARHELLIGPWPAGWQSPLPAQIDAPGMIRHGLQFWLAAMETVPAPWRQRLELRFAPTRQLTPFSLEPSLRPLAQVLCQKLVKQVLPSCSHLFK
ncbi:Yop proteins translocation protein K [Aeromonas schubertii]|uniref:Type III secretion cytoplasmic protein (YscK) n=1 Tax=Aeromonas schubertii TaxID=652 RepID=A0A0S2SIB2_9GAMM|nr:Yop proteins translocation protein K [Aeromonas schubertii]ALP41438.1 type III secretion cytoplasmic protein (YscK) [Aeromonas schubertii]MBZ6074336.1 Yop proteins translocation protein K [Aeromonas schubertii]